MAVAAAVASAMGGARIPEIIATAQQSIPAESWTAAAIALGAETGRSASDLWSALPSLYQACVSHAYFWSDCAPEAVGLAFGIIAASKGEFCDAVLGGVNVGRDTDTIAAIAGAIIGAQLGIDAIPAPWKERVRLVRGRCLSVVGGMEITDTAGRLAELSARWNG
jgi:ADP-ribosylglycohydrolase